MSDIRLFIEFLRDNNLDTLRGYLDLFIDKNSNSMFGSILVLESFFNLALISDLSCFWFDNL